MTETKQQNCNIIENGHSITSIEKNRKDEIETSEGPTVTLPNSVLNKLFTTFYVNQRREALKWFLSAYLCFSVYTIGIPADQIIQNRGKLLADGDKECLWSWEGLTIVFNKFLKLLFLQLAILSWM